MEAGLMEIGHSPNRS